MFGHEFRQDGLPTGALREEGTAPVSLFVGAIRVRAVSV